jgi:diaminohydroxyphosphoribosylaminopyrimidine deaminase/5-amino-6-(5-phosphoribosylamino)uracil reductase
LYCTLEPCCHTGRTGPCATAVANAGVVRVVAALRDPNPRVGGGGFAYLRGRGIDVDEGEAASQAASQNAPFFTWVSKRRPFVTIKFARSTDGFVGRRDERVRLTNPDTDRWFQRQRAEIDAIAVGAETALVDDPLLTAREVFRYRPLTRVLFDRRARVPATARVFSTLDAGPVIIVVARSAAGDRRAHMDALEQRGVSILWQEDGSLEPVLRALADRGIVTLLVEGGPVLQQSFAEAGLMDCVQEIVTPHFLRTGVFRPHVGLPVSPAPTRVRPFGDDYFFEYDVYRAD